MGGNPTTNHRYNLIISLSATVLSAFFGTLMAYSLARFNTGGSHLSFWVLSQRFLPPVAVVLPVFLIYRNVGLHDTHIGLIVAYTVFTLPVSVWMMFAYFRQMPKSMEDAALVDGCTRWQAFWQVQMEGKPTDLVGSELGMSPATVRKAKFRVLRGGAWQV